MNHAGHKSAISGILELLIIATALAIAFNIAIMLMPVPFNHYFFDTLQFLWPLLSIILLLFIYHTGQDANIKSFTGMFAVALIPWTITILLWEVLLPLFFNNSLAYYVSGFGFLVSYLLLMYGLYQLRSSKQWYIAPSTNIYINILTALAVVATLAFVAFNIRLDSPRLPDVLILLLYLFSDIVILSRCSKLINMNLTPELKYLVFVVAEFVLINSVADILFEARWLVSLNYLASYKITDVIDPLYLTSLIFMAAALILYQSRLKDWMLARMGAEVGGRMLFVEDIVANSPDPMFVCDDLGFLTVANEPLLGLFGARRADVIGHFNIFDHLGRKGEEIAGVIGQVKALKVAAADNVPYSRDGGSTRFLSVRIFPLTEPGVPVTNYAGILADTTERLRIEEELLDSKRQIELYMDLMGHDINNMNQVGAGYLELVMDRLDQGMPIGRESRPFLEKSMEAFRNSSRLIANIRKMRRVRSRESGTGPVDLGSTIAQAIEMAGNVRGRKIDILYQPAAGQLVRADDLLKDVFVNLIGNAIKHSPPDRPLTIGITVDSVAREGCPMYRVGVEDDGPGIDDALKKDLFRHFSPGPGRVKGLGLYLVGTLVEYYGGQIWVEDRVPGDRASGSRFLLLLPAASH